MNYRKHYDALMDRAKNRVLFGYSESHHVVPKCLGGSNEPSNLVRLTPEEHFVAHQLLVKIHVGNPKLIYAIRAMMMNGRSKERSPNKAFGWLRRLYASVDGNRKGAKHTEETKLRMSVSASKRRSSQETKAKISASHKGKVKTPEHMAKIAEALRGKPGTRRGAIVGEVTRQRMREAWVRRRLKQSLKEI